MTDPTPERAAVEHPFDRQRRAFFGIPALLLIAAVFVIGGAEPQIEARDAAVADYRAAAVADEAAEQSVTAALDRLNDIRDQVNALVALLSPIAQLGGEPVPPEAAAALGAALETAATALPAIDQSDTSAAPADESELALPALRAATAELAQRAADDGASASLLSSKADQSDEIATALGTAVGAYVTAVTQRGVALLGEHPNATPDQVSAFRSALDALPDAATENLSPILRSAVTAAAKLG